MILFYRKLRGINTLILLMFFIYGNAQEKPEIKANATDWVYFSPMYEEKDIRRLNEIIINRIEQVTDSFEVKYDVSFTNNSYYETFDLEYIFTEENAIDKIKEIEISAKPKGYKYDKYSTISLDLKTNAISYSVAGYNRDWVFNTQTDILDRINLLENKVPFIGRNKGIIAILIGIIFGVLYFIFIGVQKMVETATRDDKGEIKDLSSSYFSLSIIIGFISGFLTNTFLKKLYPDYFFLIGDEIIRYTELISLRSTIFNTILIGLMVSIVAGLVVNFFTKKKITND